MPVAAEIVLALAQIYRQVPATQPITLSIGKIIDHVCTKDECVPVSVISGFSFKTDLTLLEIFFWTGSVQRHR